MAIYEISRTDAVQPGEFVSAVVIARGTDLARRSVAHLPGVVVSGKGRNIKAEPLDTTGPTRLVAVYEDETPTLDDALATVVDAPEYLS